MHCKFGNVYNTYRNTHKWATVPVFIDVLNTYLEQVCMQRLSYVMGHFKGTVKVHGAHNVTYKTFRLILHKRPVF